MLCCCCSDLNPCWVFLYHFKEMFLKLIISNEGICCMWWFIWNWVCVVVKCQQMPLPYTWGGLLGGFPNPLLACPAVSVARLLVWQVDSLYLKCPLSTFSLCLCSFFYPIYWSARNLSISDIQWSTSRHSKKQEYMTHYVGAGRLINWNQHKIDKDVRLA